MKYLNGFGMYDFDLPEGWFFNNFGVIQKTKGRVYCYIQRYIDFYCLQLYERKNTFMCDLEIRNESLAELFDQAEQWLETYKDGDMEEVHSDYYSPHNPKGYWVMEYKAD